MYKICIFELTLADTWRVVPGPELCLFSFSPTSGSTRACTDAFRPGWTPGPKSTCPATWPPTPTSGWWERNKKVCGPAPPAATLRSFIISTLTSTGWSTEHCSPSAQKINSHSLHAASCQGWLHIYSSFMGSFYPNLLLMDSVAKIFWFVKPHFNGMQIFNFSLQELFRNFVPFFSSFSCKLCDTWWIFVSILENLTRLSKSQLFYEKRIFTWDWYSEKTLLTASSFWSKSQFKPRKRSEAVTQIEGKVIIYKE